jgi:hypothetical protein
LRAVVRGIGRAYEVYVQRFQDQGLDSLEDLGGMNAEALSDELMRLGVTEFKALKKIANRMARELVKSRPS